MKTAYHKITRIGSAQYDSLAKEEGVEGGEGRRRGEEGEGGCVRVCASMRNIALRRMTPLPRHRSV